MKTILFILIAGIATIVLLAALGPMILLGISLVIAYYGVRRFILSNSIAGKIGWAVMIVLALSIALSNTTALVGILAFVILYYIYKAFKNKKTKGYEDDWVVE